MDEMTGLLLILLVAIVLLFVYGMSTLLMCGCNCVVP